MPQSENARGAFFMTISMGGFALNDTLMKVTFETMPLAQGLFLRGLFASVVILAITWHSGALAFRPHGKDILILGIRTGTEILATVSFMLAIANTPLTAVTAIMQAAPLLVTMTAALFLSEPVGWRRWTAIGVGFLGMMIMIRPGGDSFDVYSVLALFAVVCVVIRDVSTRYLSPEIPSSFAATVTVVGVSSAAGLVSVLEGWDPVPASSLTLYTIAGGCIVFGYIVNTMAMRLGEVSAVAPFRYTVLVYALVLGFVVFGEMPDGPTLAGATIVMGAGLYTLWREKRVSTTRTAARAPAHPLDGSDSGRLAAEEPLSVPLGSVQRG